MSTGGQKLESQLDALRAAGCRRIFAEKLSGKNADRPELVACLDFLAPGDTLVVPALDRLGCGLQGLITIVGDLRGRGTGFRNPPRERVLWRMLYETCARAEEILSLNVPDVDMEFRRALVTEKGGDRAYVHWETPTARLLPRLPAGCPTRAPSTCSSRRPSSTTRTAPGTPCTNCATPG